MQQKHAGFIFLHGSKNFNKVDLCFFVGIDRNSEGRSWCSESGGVASTLGTAAAWRDEAEEGEWSSEAANQILGERYQITSKQGWFLS